ncbi:uncharacterized protein LOC111031675 isoform X1 [Myzus persicae]|uniref:uncharacterized protein LOC111031675 isoform X1 n=2 Tax=Myzus persicae TaxID=13164 RepID=UPI000B934036|nr:uncharacterized protein LOC111031675 isoform X1 [Myzus persicae]XP_022167415.1 uncharacterized protein LOC111031675 isoform X1 [Myzus persicae]
MMEKQKKEYELKQSLRPKSSTIKSVVLDCSDLSNPKIKENQETEVLTMSTPTDHPQKKLKHLNLFSNLQSTPNTRHFNKPELDSRIIMNLSPITSTSSLKTNLYSHKDIYQHKSHAEIDFSLNPLKYQNSSNLCKKHELNKWKTNKTSIEPAHKSNIIDSLIVPNNPKKTNEDIVNEKAKRCLFEKEKEITMSNLETDQDSLNISLDILEQVCQMSEIMDDSLTEEVKISDDTNKKKKLASFLYGNSTIKLDDTEEENKLLQLALSMEDNVLTESRSKNKLYFEGKFTSLNQLKNKGTNLSKYDSEQSKSNKLNTCISDSKCNFLDPEEMNSIGNTQMCEIADITEPLESFDDQWTQQYTNNESNFSNTTKENNFNKDFDAVISTPIDFIDHKVNIKKSNSLHSSNERLKISIVRDELNIPPIVTQDDTLTNDNICKGFSTAGGKSIKVSDEALKKVQTMLKDEFNEYSTVNQDNIVVDTKIPKGFATAAGKSIKVSDVALKKVQTMLKDELNESSIITQHNTVLNTNEHEGFSTAGGKSIKVSDVALKKVQTMLNDELNESLGITQDSITINPNKLCNGFATAGGKTIAVSNKALQKVQRILKDEYSLAITKDKTTIKSNIGIQFLNAGDKSIIESDKSLKDNQSTFKDDSQLFDSSLETMAISSDYNNSNKVSKLTNDLKTKSDCFEISKHEEECTFEDDLSLINTVEKFERDQIVCKPVQRNKRPGSPINTHEINYKIKKTVLNDGWEINELNTSFSVYLSNKLNGPKVLLPEVVDWVLPKIFTLKQFPENGVAKELIKLNVDNAIHLKLYWEKNYKLSDGHKNKMYSFQDLKYLFLSHNFVDGKLIPKGWIENHFRFIAWKLAATEICFPDHFGNKLLTAKNIIHQLLYRYYREIEKCQRSALKKILEKDETTSKRIILCVSKISRTNSAETFTIELTDGWYSVKGIIDYEMNMLLHKGIIKVGTKLITYNAELIGAGEGIDPLDVDNSVKLKISTNSTRRVRWYAKLGFYKNSTLPIPITLESILPHGGIIGSLSLVILRKYPVMFLEKKTNSKSIFRNEKMETIEAEKYKAYQQKSLEIISNKIKTELIAEIASKTKVSKKYFSSMKKENLDKLNIDELSNVLENSTDPLEIQSLLSQEKLEALKDFKKLEQDRFYNELQNRVNRVFNDQFKDARKVIPMIKLRVVDKKYVSTGFKAALLTIWNPSEDVTEILNKSTEGQCCIFHHITTNGFMNGELQLSANKNTRFDFQGYENEYVKRDVVSFKSIWSCTFLPLFGELDLVGIVVSDVNKNNAYNEIYVSDKEMNIISILFRGNIKEYGYDDMMYPGSIISGINIQFKGFNQISPIPKLYNTEQSLFTTIPKTEYILNIFDDYKMFMKKPENQNFLICCQTKLSEIFKRLGETTTMNNEQCLNKSKTALNKSYGELPIAVVKTSNTSQTECSPAQKRIKMLKSFGKTPPLNIVHTKPPDKKLLGQFKTPTRL